jgi:hypothetical protein
LKKTAATYRAQRANLFRAKRNQFKFAAGFRTQSDFIIEMKYLVANSLYLSVQTGGVDWKGHAQSRVWPIIEQLFFKTNS